MTTPAVADYVNPEQLRKALKLRDAADPRLHQVCTAVSDAMDWAMGRTDSVTVSARLDPVPPGVADIALSAAVDFWKQPDAGFGIAGLSESGPVRIPRNIMGRFAEQLAPYVIRYGIA